MLLLRRSDVERVPTDEPVSVRRVGHLRGGRRGGRLTYAADCETLGDERVAVGSDVSAHGWVALLRGVNLGARNKVPMADLRRVLAERGCADVRTYIQSGNALFRHTSDDRAALADALETAVEETFGISTPVVLRRFAELRRVADSHPFDDDGANTYVAFLAGPPSREAVRDVERLDIAPDRVVVNGEDVYLHYRDGVQGARLSAAQLERRLGVPATVRNWRTVTKLAELAAEP